MTNVEAEAEVGSEVGDGGEVVPFQITRHRASIIHALRKAGGEVEDKGGRAVGQLTAHMKGDPPKTISTILQTMEKQGVIAREVRGKRTYRIMLVDGVVVDKIIEAQPPSLTVVHTPPTYTTDEINRLIHGVEVEGKEGVDYPSLADALLTRVSQLLGQEGTKPDYDTLLTRLHKLTEDRERAIARAELAEELATTRGKELEGVRRRLLVAEGNIARMLKGGRIGVGSETRKVVERFMQERPHQPGGDK